MQVCTVPICRFEFSFSKFFFWRNCAKECRVTMQSPCRHGKQIYRLAADEHLLISHPHRKHRLLQFLFQLYWKRTLGSVHCPLGLCHCCPMFIQLFGLMPDITIATLNFVKSRVMNYELLFLGHQFMILLPWLCNLCALIHFFGKLGNRLAM